MDTRELHHSHMGGSEAIAILKEKGGRHAEVRVLLLLVNSSKSRENQDHDEQK
jgi:hypothetical protein